jgi:preprotein translocase subunit YajC
MPVFIVYFALLAVAFFFLIVRPQRRQLAARRALVQAVEVGDEIITAGGIYGVVQSIDEDTMQVEIAPGVVMTLAREAVARRREDDPPAPGTIDLSEPTDSADPTATDAAPED